MNKKLELEVGDEFCIADPKTKELANSKIYIVIKDNKNTKGFFLIVNLKEHKVVDRFETLDDMNKFLVEAWPGFEIVKTNTSFAM